MFTTRFVVSLGTGLIGGLIGLVLVAGATVAVVEQALLPAARWGAALLGRFLARQGDPAGGGELTWSAARARIQQARQRLAGGQATVRPLDGIVPPAAGSAFLVEGDGVAPQVVAFPRDRPTGACSCPDFAENRGPACEHLALVVLDRWPEAFERWEAGVRDLCAPQPEPEPPDPDPLEEQIQQAVDEALATLGGQMAAAITQVLEDQDLGEQ